MLPGRRVSGLADFDPWDEPAPAAKPRRRRRHVENDDYLAFVIRILKAAEKRIASADPEDLAAMAQLRAALDQAIDGAARGMHDNGYSWTEIAAPLGISRQAALKRWGTK